MEFGDISIIGGGCYGTYYLRQLERARSAGAVDWRRVVVVDRDPDCAVGRDLGRRGEAHRGAELVVAEWGEYLRRVLTAMADSGADCGRDAIVPSPLMPHVLFEWLLHRARKRWPERRVAVVPVDRSFELPWESLAPDGTRYLSYADWTCPINCIEPARCPHTRDTRSWSLPVALRTRLGDLAQATPSAEGVVAFHCTHRVYGVGMIDLADVVAADSLIARRAERASLRVFVGTTSHCHGALSALEVGVPRVPDDG
jgi:hypothetical protein